MNKKILVTGGAGFIGSNLVELLKLNNYSVTVLDNLVYGNLKNIENLDVDFLELDINNFDRVNEIVPGFDCVVHLAAMVSVPESVENPFECYKTNVLSTINIMDLCVENNINFIFASSAAVYGEDLTPIKTEDINVKPISPYGLSKFDIEVLADIYHREKGLNYTCFRNFNVYGPKQNISSAYAAVIPIFISRCLNNNDLFIYGDGKQTRDFIYVGDVCKAYLLAIEKPFNDVFNLGCDDVKSVNDLARDIKFTIRSESQIIYSSSRKGDIKHSKASSKKFRSISNWVVDFDLNKGIDLTVEYYRNGK